MSMFNTTPNTAQKTVERGGKIVEESTIAFDAYKDLMKEGGHATVSCTYALGVDFNSEKVTFHVTCRCDQSEATINEAGKRVFAKAVEFVNDAAEVLGWKNKK
jgi:hypothetical protein